MVGIRADEIGPDGLQYIDILSVFRRINDQGNVNPGGPHPRYRRGVAGFEIGIGNRFSALIGDIDQKVLFMFLKNLDHVRLYPPVHHCRQHAPVSGGIMEFHHGNHPVFVAFCDNRIKFIHRPFRSPDNTYAICTGFFDLGKCIAVQIGPDGHFIDTPEDDLFSAAIIQKTACNLESGKIRTKTRN